VDQVLHRLVRAGTIRRITRGLYDKPNLNALTGKSTDPDPRSVIDALARRDSARMIVDGITATNDIGLSDAVPAHIIVYTYARLKSLALGNLTIRFRTTAPSKLFWAGRPAMRVVQALHWHRDTLQSDAPRVRKRLQSIFADPAHGSAITADLRDGLSTLPILTANCLPPNYGAQGDNRRWKHLVCWTLRSGSFCGSNLAKAAEATLKSAAAFLSAAAAMFMILGLARSAISG
jgi:Family of unknown function (DUF6088)